MVWVQYPIEMLLSRVRIIVIPSAIIMLSLAWSDPRGGKGLATRDYIMLAWLKNQKEMENLAV